MVLSIQWRQKVSSAFGAGALLETFQLGLVELSIKSGSSASSSWIPPPAGSCWCLLLSHTAQFSGFGSQNGFSIIFHSGLQWTGLRPYMSTRQLPLPCSWSSLLRSVHGCPHSHSFFSTAAAGQKAMPACLALSILPAYGCWTGRRGVDEGRAWSFPVYHRIKSWGNRNRRCFTK